VGAVDSLGEHPTFSQTGAHLSLVAPGVSVLSTTVLGAPVSRVLVAGGQIPSEPFEHSAEVDYTGRLVDCGEASPAVACPEATCEGFVAYVRGGSRSFSEQVKTVQAQGARAVILATGAVLDGPFTLEGPGPWPAVVAVNKATGEALAKKAGSTARVGLLGADYARRTGTSMATPHVVAAAALLWSARPGLTPLQVRELLERSAMDLGPPGRDPTFGFGLVQVRSAWESMTAP
jgi:subtilisin family serine protease